MFDFCRSTFALNLSNLCHKFTTTPRRCGKSNQTDLQCTKLRVNCKQQNITLPLLKPTIRRPVISNDGALAWYEKNIIIEPNKAGRLFNNRVLLLKRKKIKTGLLMIGYADFFIS